MRSKAGDPRAVGEWGRREVLTGLAAGWIVLRPGRVRAEGPIVAAPARCVGAILAAVGGTAIQFAVDPEVSPTMIKVDGVEVDVTAKVLLKGSGEPRARFLDDARNAARVGANIRDALTAARPDLGDTLAANQRAWAKPFARKAFQWSKRLAESSVRGKAVEDPHGRQYLLEWAGATVKKGGPALPSGLDTRLAALPTEPAGTDLRAYEAYLEALVSALG